MTIMMIVCERHFVREALRNAGVIFAALNTLELNRG